MTEQWKRLGALIARYRGPLTQETLAEMVSEKAGITIKQATVSEHERGNRWGKQLDLVGIYADVLHIPPREIHEALGLPLDPDADHPRPPTFPELVARDETLSKAARDHLLNQYELLQMATMHQRSGDPVLHEDKAQSKRGSA